MNRQLRALTLFTCITAATAFTGGSAFADYGVPCEGPGARSGQHQKHQGHKGQKGRHDGRFLDRMARQLDLSLQQQTQAKTLFEKGRAEHKPLMEAMHGERNKLQALVHSGNADEAAIRSQAAKVAAVQADLAVLRGQQAKQFSALLTPEQADKLKELGEKSKGHFRGHKGCRQEL